MPQQAGLWEHLRSVSPDFIDEIEHDRTIENSYAARLRHAEGNDRAQRELQAAMEAHLWPLALIRRRRAERVATLIVGSVGLFEWELLLLLSRPMLAFTFVLGSLRHA